MSKHIAENIEATDGVATLRAFLDEVWSALGVEQLSLTAQARFRLDYMRNELLEMQEPDAIADGLVLLGRQFERHAEGASQVVAFYQLALQCNPRQKEALIAAISRFRRLGRWSMVLKLLKVYSEQSEAPGAVFVRK